MAPTTLISSFIQKKVKSKQFASCWQQHWACLNHVSFKMLPRSRMNPSRFFFFLMLKYLHLCSCLPRHCILEDADYCLDNAKCPQMPFLSMALDTSQHPSSTRHSFIQKEKKLNYCRVFFSLPGVRNLQHLGFRPAKCWPLSSFTRKWSGAILYKPCLAWFNI